MVDRDSRAAKIRAAAPKDNSRRNTGIAAACIIVVVTAVVFAVWQGVSSNQSSTDTSAVTNAPAGVSMEGKGINAFPTVSPASGAPTVELFTDFQCPYCAHLEEANGRMIHAMAKAGDITLINRPMVFLDEKLGAGPEGSSHLGTNAALCAAKDGKYQDFAELLFSHQPANEGDGFADGVYGEVADAIGITGQAREKFDTCVAENTYASLVAKTDEASTRENPTNGTPALLINGKTVSKEDVAQLYQVPNSFETVLKKYT